MKDRNSLHPGRVRMIPVAGQAGVYDMEMVDEPIQVGTPLNATNLLRDDTATALGLVPESATVADALARLEAAKVNATTTVNGKPLSGNIILNASDVHARADTWMPTANDVGARPNTWTPTVTDIGAVPTTRTVNGKALSANISLAASDVGALGSTATAAKATQLATSRTIRTNLASTSTASFNGTANITPGVTGVLPVANGGTGSSTEKYLPLAGGSLTGNISLAGGGTTHSISGLSNSTAVDEAANGYDVATQVFQVDWRHPVTQTTFNANTSSTITWADGKDVLFFDPSNPPDYSHVRVGDTFYFIWLGVHNATVVTDGSSIYKATIKSQTNGSFSLTMLQGTMNTGLRWIVAHTPTYGTLLLYGIAIKIRNGWS